MPYIKKEFRTMLDSQIEELAKAVKEIHTSEGQSRDGLLNYAITKLLDNVYANARYHDYNEAIGMLECCKLEYYRERVSPYEDVKKAENGDV